jgi:hypothetical protein
VLRSPVLQFTAFQSDAEVCGAFSRQWAADEGMADKAQVCTVAVATGKLALCRSLAYLAVLHICGHA